MSSFEVVSLIGLVAVALLGAAQYGQSREIRKALERLSRGESARAMLGQRSVHVRKALPEPAREAPPATDDRSTRVDAPQDRVPAADRKRAREPFKPPSLAPAPDYATQVRRPAPDAVQATPADPPAPRDRRIVATRASMPAVMPTSTRPEPTVNVVEANEAP